MIETSQQRQGAVDRQRLTMGAVSGPLRHNTPEISGGSGSLIEDCLFAGPSYFGEQCLFRRSNIGRYSSFGDRCKIIDTIIGSFCSFGDNIVFNGGVHPQSWMSTHLFQCHPSAWQWSRDYTDAQIQVRKCTWRRAVTIGNDVWICNNVVIGTGVTVGDGAIIAANAVVTADVPPYALVGGAPAGIKKYRFSEQVIQRLLAVRWWDRPLSALANLPFDDIEVCLKTLEQEAAPKGS